ncbi:MAG: NADH-quinone oxidoreductase subunit M, partial [Bacteroidota bacterium]
AVYILRAAGKTIMGPITNTHYEHLNDASWNEKFAAVVLISGILIVGMAPFLLIDLIQPGTEIIINKLGVAINH